MRLAILVIGMLGVAPNSFGQYTLSGNVTDSYGAGLTGVLVELRTGSTSVTSAMTDGSGSYTFSNLNANTNFSVSAVKAGYTFEPANRIFLPLGGNQVANFAVKPDVIWQNQSTRQASIWHLSGTWGTSVAGFDWLHGTGVPGWRVVAIADFDGNGTRDAIWQNDNTFQSAIWYLGGGGGSQVLGFQWLHATGDPGWRVVGAADFDRDGKPDVVWQNDATRQAAIWYLGGASGVQVQKFQWLHATGAPGWRVATVGDLDGNSTPDIIWQNDSSWQTSVWFMGGPDGNTVQAFQWLNATGTMNWRAAAVADFNSDGKLDVVWQNEITGQASIWYLSGTQALTISAFQWLHPTGDVEWRITATR